MEPELKVAYTKIVTISTDAMLEANEMRDGLGAHWPFLIEAVADGMAPHPTLSEAIRGAALVALGQAIDVPNKPAHGIP